MYCDAHLHIADIENWAPFSGNTAACSCFHSIDEWNRSQSVSIPPDFLLVRSFGIHPQNPDADLIDFFLSLCGNRFYSGLNAVGEAGFDLFTDDYKKTIESQEKVWQVQLQAGKKYNLPLVIHCRHALDRIFRDSSELKKVPSIIFHSFAGSYVEAQSLLKRGINAFFSFGKPLLNGNKRALQCTEKIGIERLLLETDAPYQTLKGETVTECSDLIKVYEKTSQLRALSIEILSEKLQENFRNAFCSNTSKKNVACAD